MNDYEVHYIEPTDTNEGIAGWYWCDDGSTPSDWSWLNRGNGPEVSSDHVGGPFKTEQDARLVALARATG